jgi:hypothetical protein
MNETCGCCKGIHKLTPVTRLNRPGLNALSYRVGTHASFLETMKSRLSSLELAPEDFEPGVGPQPIQPRPLLNLTTRASSDPSIALLDAWATIADVLTFYQERIANEGFLPTATERGSILELARLIGYRLRPGVAATVFFAYTLEKNSAVEIPAGTRAQSVPGPGELPQSFETSDKLLARSEWNTLQTRITRPQIPHRQRPLYFKGTATKLKPNDRLLLALGDDPPILLRVLTVFPDQARGHTQVIFEEWNQTPSFAAPSSDVSNSGELAAPGALSDSLNNLPQIIERLKRAEGFEINTATQTAQRVIGQLDQLARKIEAMHPNTGLQQLLDEALPPLREEHRLATEGNFTKLLPWIDAIVSELEQASERFANPETNISELADTQLSAELNPSTSLARFARLRATSSSIRAGSESSLAGVIALADDLDKPVSQPPASSRQLGRTVTGSFSTASDALPKLLVAMRPSLSDVLYRAWENLPVSPPVPVRVYALRTQASVFGHNAPLKPVIDPTSGRVIRTEEWTLFNEAGPGAEEDFSIILAFFNQTLQFQATVNFTIAGQQATATTGKISLNGSVTQTLNISAANETVTLAVSDFTQNAGAKFTFDFAAGKFQVVIDWKQEDDKRHITVGGTGKNLVLVENTVAPATHSAFGNNSIATVAGVVTGPPTRIPTEDPNKVSLEAAFKEIVPGGWAVLEKPPNVKGGNPVLRITKINRVREMTRADYGISAPGTQLELVKAWIDDGDGFEIIRSTRVFAQSELLELAEEPIEEPICGSRLELDNLVRGLDSGRWLIVSGERTDIKLEARGGATVEEKPAAPAHVETAASSTSNDAAAESAEPKTAAPKEVLPGVTASELVMLAGVEQGYDTRFPGDKTHTTLILSQALAYCYKRDTVTIYGNVVKATHGETKNEVLGSGDGGQALQQFSLRQSPLTYLSAPTPAGAESTLQVRVNDLLWHETETLAGLGPRDRRYITRTDDKDQTTVQFGNGEYGSRLATGVENVKAVYRVGIGSSGNVKARQITSVVTKPLGVKEVINPLPATGGANREDRDQARRNAPMAVMALDRLISVQDYEDFARTYAGVAKASSARLSDGRRQLVHLTIAGSDDIPIATTSDLFLNLRQALRQFGDPYQSLQIAVRKLKLLVISAKVRLKPDYLWEAVEPALRTALFEKFGFARRELGQDALPSEALSVMQAHAGVAYVDLDTFDAVGEDTSPQGLANLGTTLKLQPRVLVNKAKINPRATDPTKRILPAELAYLNPVVADTLILTELTG